MTKLQLIYECDNIAEDGFLKLKIDVEYYEAGTGIMECKDPAKIEYVKIIDMATGLPYEHEEWLLNNPYHKSVLDGMVYTELTNDFWAKIDADCDRKMDAQRDEQFS